MTRDDDEHEKTGRRRFITTTTVAAAGLAIGCGGESGEDAGGRRDAGRRDAGRVDASAEEDAGTNDAGVPEPIVPPEDTPEVAQFGLGVSSGDATSAAVILQTRYDGTMPLAAVVWEVDAAGTYILQHPRRDVTPADGGFVHAEVSGLRAGARHRYAFFEMDGETRVGRSTVGRFRSAIRDRRSSRFFSVR